MISTRQLNRFKREHALFTTCACFLILLIGLPVSSGKWPSLNFSSLDSRADESQLDAALQQAAADALGQREGTIIVIDPQTGRLRALVNSQLAFGQAAMPGSTMKPFTALAALRAGLIEKESRTVCPGRFAGRNFSLPCVHEDHLPPFTPAQAIAYSCNYYFATLGQRLGRDALIATARQFGFGEPTGIRGMTGSYLPTSYVGSMSNESAGIVRPCEAGNDARIRDSIFSQTDCDAREAIGESDRIQTTPMQLLLAYTALMNGGRLFQPATDNSDPIERRRIDISAQQRAIIMEGMRGAVRYGTARSTHLDSLPLYILGKTGTSQPVKGFRPNGWFVGFASHAAANASAEPNTTEIDLGVLILAAHSHGSEAATLAKPIFEAFARQPDGSQRSEASTRKDAGEANHSSQSSSIKVHLVTENVSREMSLEDYVLGVMRAEGSMETEPDALKALAIAIRTYATKNHARHAKDGYDFCSTTHCQRFVEGTASAAITAAVRATEGQVLIDEQGLIVDSYFGASCGGETANIGALWGKNPPVYLRGVRDEYCAAGPHASWTDNISRADLLRALDSDARTNIGARLDRVYVSKRDETGRAQFITIEGENRKIVRGWDFKIIVGRVLGWSVLKSSRFEVSRTAANFVFHGSGFGHGLGLCQEGAHVMAQRGITYQRILQKYFPGTRVATRSGIVSLIPPRMAEDDNEKKYIMSPSPAPLQTQWSADALPPSTAADRFARSAAHSANYHSRFLTISSENFRVTYPAEMARSDADQVVNILESARGDFLRRASSAESSTALPLLEIRLNESTGDFTARTGQPWWAAAATKGSRIELQPVAILKRRGVLLTTLRHELAHVVIDSLSNNRAPRWLAEGFALYLAGEGSTISHYASRTKLTDDELEQRLERPASQSDMRALYALAYQRVAAIIRGSGENAVWRQLVRH